MSGKDTMSVVADKPTSYLTVDVFGMHGFLPAEDVSDTVVQTPTMLLFTVQIEE
jgi:ribosomal protein S1